MDFVITSQMDPQAGAEMALKIRPTSLFAAQFTDARPLSEAVTDISDSDWEDENEYGGDDGSGSEFEEESPRGSFDSFGQRSGTTVSTLDEAPTPMSNQKGLFDVKIRRNPSQSIQGPRGPHLFRASIDSSRDFSFDYALQLSPLLTKDQSSFGDDKLVLSPISIEPYPSHAQVPAASVASSDKAPVSNWTCDQVVAWMYSAGFEKDVIQKFESHDVTGAILLSLQFEDLKELEIQSFGKRHKVWNQLAALRSDNATSPAPTLFEDGSRPATQNSKKSNLKQSSRPQKASASTPITPGGGSRRGRIQRLKNPMDEVITPQESISIVAIEQLLPKPHKCSKGENCSKWKKQQRLRDQLDREGFAISPAGGGQILIAGNPGDALAADNMFGSTQRPTSEAAPSLVASSDLLGAGHVPNFSLQEHVQSIERRDPQEHVKQFLNFNHLKLSADVPPTPPLETPRFEPAATGPLWTPRPSQQPHANLKQLPKLAIPGASPTSQPGSESPCEDLRTPTAGVNRLGTPASEMDMPITRISFGPVAREASQSVPPNMRYRKPIKHRPGSREPNSWRGSSLQAMPTLPENGPPSAKASNMRNSTRMTYGSSTTHAGWMKKRKTKLLRHEWQERHFRLTGTKLDMHDTAKADDAKVLETIDVDDYAVACSSIGSQSKLAAALKSLKLKKDGQGSIDDTAFIFQLIPAAERAKMMGLLKDGKTHHFAVKTRNERIDWMREVMLAKALKQKADKGACEVTINGHAIHDGPTEI